MYVLPRVSLDACKELNIVHKNFPHVTPQAQCISMIHTSNKSDTIIQNKPKIPVPPLEIPFPPMEDNVALLQEWLLQQFADTTFKVDGPYPLCMVNHIVFI